jgi:CO/xanthine dehydrogenase FAD-binding subunit
MREFAYARPESAEEAVRLVAAGDAAYLAGGTNLVDLMKLGVARPGLLVDVTALGGCPARTGEQHNLAIIGASEQCIATHPSDMAVALSALDAVIHVQEPAGRREIPLADFYLLPGDRPDRETVLSPGALITQSICRRCPSRAGRLTGRSGSARPTRSPSAP